MEIDIEGMHVNKYVMLIGIRNDRLMLKSLVEWTPDDLERGHPFYNYGIKIGVVTETYVYSNGVMIVKFHDQDRLLSYLENEWGLRYIKYDEEQKLNVFYNLNNNKVIAFSASKYFEEYNPLK